MSKTGDAAVQAMGGWQRVYPRLRAFGIALTGAMRAGAGLAQAALANLDGRESAEEDTEAMVLRAYREAYSLWAQRASQTSGRGDPRCFALPSSTPEAAARSKGLAQVIADLPAQQRATLLLIYGEGLSYDETAEIFDTTVHTVMTRAVRGHVAVEHWLDSGGGRGAGAVQGEADDAHLSARENTAERVA